MDWNSVPSGPAWEDRELNDPALWGHPGQEWARAHGVLWQHGLRAGRAFPADTRALDCLTGWWSPQTGQRERGIGFFDAAELARDPTPTQVPVPDGRLRRAIDRILVNAAWKNAIVPGSYHLRISVTIQP